MKDVRKVQASLYLLATAIASRAGCIHTGVFEENWEVLTGFDDLTVFEPLEVYYLTARDRV